MNKNQPNIVFIYADDWGWGDLGCYGHSDIKTPHLDRLAAAGTLFTKFHVCSGVCSPSRAAAITGRFPAELGIHGHIASDQQNKDRGMPNFLDPSYPTYMSLLKENGYRTGHFGKWHLGHNRESPLPAAYGIDESKVNVGNGPQLDINGFVNNSENYNPTGTNPRSLSSKVIVDESVSFINRHRKQYADRPFLVNVWLNDPHATLDPDEEQMMPYEKFMPKLAQRNYPGALAIYYAVISEADRQIGRLLKTLDDLNLTDNTIIIFSSDNGPEAQEVFNASHSAAGSPGPFRGRKRSLYEGGIRTPFIIKWTDKIPAGEINDHTVLSAVDLLPTFCDISHTPFPESLEQRGEVMTDVLCGSRRQRETLLFWEWRGNVTGHIWNKAPRLAVMDGAWKLLFNPPDGTVDRHGERIELYNIDRDLMEINEISGQHPDTVERLKAEALRWFGTLPEGPVPESAGGNSYPYPGKLLNMESTAK